MKKKIFLLTLLTQMSLNSFAAGDGKSEINSLIGSWLIPGCAIMFVLFFIGLCIYHADGLRGRNGLSKSDAWTAVFEGLAIVLVIISAVGALVAKLAAWNFQI